MTLAETILSSKLAEGKNLPDAIAEHIVSFLHLAQKEAFRACLAENKRHTASSGDLEISMYGMYLVFFGPAFKGRRRRVSRVSL